MISSKRFKNFGMAAAAAIVLLGAYIFLTGEGDPRPTSLLTPGTPNASEGALVPPPGTDPETYNIVLMLEELKSITLHGDILKDPTFRFLSDFSRSLAAEERGRANPFIAGEGVRTPPPSARSGR